MRKLIRISALAVIGLVAFAAACASWLSAPVVGNARPALPPTAASEVAPTAVRRPTPTDASLAQTVSTFDEANADGLDDRWRIAGDDRIDLDSLAFGDAFTGAALTELEPNVSAIAPAPEISTAVMLALGLVFTTARRAGWKALRTAPALARAC